MQVERSDLSGSGERLSNAQVTYPQVGDNPEKCGLIPHIAPSEELVERKAFGRLRRGLCPIR